MKLFTPIVVCLIAFAPFAPAYDAVLLENHGVLAWGRDLEQAYLRLELVEHLARIALVAAQLGGVRPVPQSAMPALLEARRKAGLGAAATSTANPASSTSYAPRAVIACAPPPPGSDVVLLERPRAARPGKTTAELTAMIREEIVAALKK